MCMNREHPPVLSRQRPTFPQTRIRRPFISVLMALAAAPVAADTTTGTGALTAPMTVWGRGLDLIGEAASASEGVVGYADFETRPLTRAGELVEVIPGMVATQHSGTGKANQYFLRGFNLDHGTDFSVSVDGVPVNLRTHGHGQGYLDLNFIIPELVERVEYRKGPYHPEVGDFSSAGSARMLTYDWLPEGFAEMAGGENGFVRGVAANSFRLGGTDLLIAGEGMRYDGPWVLDERLKKYNGLVKLRQENAHRSLGLSFTAYDARWRSTDQVPLRAVEQGLIDRLGFIDPDLGGQTTRFSLAADGRWRHGGTETRANVYAVDYDFTLYSNFTYFLEDPVNGDEFEQRDRRRYYGGEIQHQRPAQLAGLPLLWRLGLQSRYDDISEVGLYQTQARRRIGTVRQDAVKELSVSGFAEAELALTPALRAHAGLRADYYHADVDAETLAANSGIADDTMLSPSAGLAWRVAAPLELYANYGQGFHSNDARGATISVEPGSGVPVAPVDLLVRSEGAELGARFERGALNLSVTGFWLKLDSELVFVGDAGTTEPNAGSERLGFEGSLFWEPTLWLAFDISGAVTHARFVDVAPGQNRIPGAVENVVGAGVVTRWRGLTASLRMRHFGSAPLLEDNSRRSDPTTLFNFGATYDWQQLRFGLQVLNLLDSDDADITYFYESRLAGEAAGVEDFNLHPVEPRQIRASVRLSF